jgi:hypothetical protein
VTDVRKATFLQRGCMKVAFLQRPVGNVRSALARADQVGATSYRARRRVNDAVPDVIARRSTA